MALPIYRHLMHRLRFDDLNAWGSYGSLFILYVRKH